jgi:hypothetical protein
MINSKQIETWIYKVLYVNYNSNNLHMKYEINQ